MKKGDIYKLKGKFTIEQLDGDEVIKKWEQENNIVISGRAWLLSMLSGIDKNSYAGNEELSYIALGKSKDTNDGLSEGVNDDDWRLSSEGTIASGGSKCREPFDTMYPPLIEDVQYLHVSSVFTDDSFPTLPYTIKEMGVFISDTPPSKDPILWAEYKPNSMFSRSIRSDNGIIKYHDGTDLRVSYKLSISDQNDESEAGWYEVEYEGFNQLALNAITNDTRRNMSMFLYEEELIAADGSTGNVDDDTDSFTIEDADSYIGRYLQFESNFNAPATWNMGYLGGYYPDHQEGNRIEIFIKTSIPVGLGDERIFDVALVQSPGVFLANYTMGAYFQLGWDTGDSAVYARYLNAAAGYTNICAINQDTWYRLLIEYDATSNLASYYVYNLNGNLVGSAVGVNTPLNSHPYQITVYSLIFPTSPAGPPYGAEVCVDEVRAYRKPYQIP